MLDQSQLPDQKRELELSHAHIYECRREFVQRLAFELWQTRGCPAGSPAVDWFAAERTLYESLVASGMASASSNASLDLGRKLYRR